MFRDFLNRLGVLRSLLAALALVIALGMPWADVSLSPEGWGLIRGIVLPASAPIVFMVVMLDLMMSQVMKADADEARRRQLNFVSRVHLVLGAALLLSWLPVFIRATYF
jgi:hypothetical protein